METTNTNKFTTFLAFTLATWFGVGFIPLHRLRGIAASLAALPLCWFQVTQVQMYMHDNPSTTAFAWLANTIAYLSITAGIGCFGFAAIGRIKSVSDKNYNEQIVIGKVIGMVFACLPLLWLNISNWWTPYIITFTMYLILVISIEGLHKNGYNKKLSLSRTIAQEIFAGLAAAVISSPIINII